MSQELEEGDTRIESEGDRMVARVHAEQRRRRANERPVKVTPTPDQAWLDVTGAVVPARDRLQLSAHVAFNDFTKHLDIGGPVPETLKAAASAEFEREMQLLADQVETALAACPGAARRTDLTQKLAAAQADEASLLRRKKELQRDRELKMIAEINPREVDVALAALEVEIRSAGEFRGMLEVKLAAVNEQLGDLRQHEAEASLVPLKAQAERVRAESQAAVLRWVRESPVLRDWITSLLVEAATWRDVIGRAGAATG